MFAIPMKYHDNAGYDIVNSDSDDEDRPQEPPSLLPAVVTVALAWLVDSIQIQVSPAQYVKQPPNDLLRISGDHGQCARLYIWLIVRLPRLQGTLDIDPGSAGPTGSCEANFAGHLYIRNEGDKAHVAFIQSTVILAIKDI